MRLGPLEPVTTLLLGVAYHGSARVQRIADDGEVDFVAG